MRRHGKSCFFLVTLVVFIGSFVSVGQAATWVFTADCDFSQYINPATNERSNYEIVITGEPTSATMLAVVRENLKWPGSQRSEQGQYGARSGKVRLETWDAYWDKEQQAFVLTRSYVSGKSCLLRGPVPPPLLEKESDEPVHMFDGTWRIFQTNNNGAKYSGRLIFVQKGKDVGGNAYWDNHENGRIAGTVSDSSVRFDIRYSSFSGRYSGSLDSTGYRINGSCFDSTGKATCSWYATKQQ